MIPLTLAEVAAAVGGTLYDGADPAARVTGAVELDSRQVGPGGLFVALRGERVDGHAYAAAAVAAGAVGVLAEQPVGVPAVLVADVPEALARLAAAVLDRLPDLVVVGVTGSSGKTSTKDLLAQLLGRLGATVAPPGSFNNELGHPYTVLRSTVDTRYLVLEYSSRGIGHIATLCRIAPPRIAAVLNVGTAHLGEFGSRAAVATAKGELVEALPPAAAGGVAVLNADDPRVLAMAERTAARVVTVGESADADVRAEDVRLDELGRPAYRLVGAAGTVDVRLALYGAHQVPNSLAAAAIATELGLSLPAVAAGLAAARPLSRWRMEVTERPDGALVVNDAYNANPESMRAALTALASMSGGRRSWAVLGHMAELGATSEVEHGSAGRLAARLGVDRLVVVGPEAGRMHTAALAEQSWRGESVHVPDAGAAVRLLREELRPTDVVLVKASRAAGLEQVALALLADDQPPEPALDPAPPVTSAAPSAEPVQPAASAEPVAEPIEPAADAVESVGPTESVAEPVEPSVESTGDEPAAQADDAPAAADALATDDDAPATIGDAAAGGAGDGDAAAGGAGDGDAAVAEDDGGSDGAERGDRLEGGR